MSTPSAPLVIDAGSGQTKAGFAGDDAPVSVFPTLVGEPKIKNVVQGMGGRDIFIGDEAIARQGILGLRYPITHGIVANWADMESIWDHTFSQELKVDPSAQPILLTESPTNPRSKREKTVEIMFERFHTPSVYVGSTAALSLYASGRTTGLMVESGAGVTHAVPIFEGKIITKSVIRMDVAGRDVTECLQRELRTSGISLTASTEFQIAEDIKHQLCYSCLNIDEELQMPPDECGKQYMLPDGSSITVGNPRFVAPEVMFNPEKYMSLEVVSHGIHRVIAKSFASCDIDLCTIIVQNIVLSGGNTMIPDFNVRLENELSKLIPSDVKVYAPLERKFSAWIGGSILASLTTFNQMAISKEEYDEDGAGAVSRKLY